MHMIGKTNGREGFGRRVELLTQDNIKLCKHSSIVAQLNHKQFRLHVSMMSKAFVTLHIV